MREIRFRAWDNYSNSFIFITLTEDPINYLVVDKPDLDLPLQPKQRHDLKLEWKQFTGLTDRHGREIYEGDIVLTNLGQRMVIYQFASFSLSDGDAVDEFGYTKYDAPPEKCEVIGNIYENGDLLK